MSTKVKRYGWKKVHASRTEKHEYATKAERDGIQNSEGWTKYAALITPAKPKGRPLWWAIRQLQEGRAVVDADGDTWWPSDDEHPNRGLFSLLQSAGADGFDDTDNYAQSWTLAVQP